MSLLSPMTLHDTVIRGNYCIGCGACAVVDKSPFYIVWNKYGQYEASLAPSSSKQYEDATALAVCPFSGIGPNEDEIARELFDADCSYHQRIGYSVSCYAGYATEGSYRSNGSSGGMVTWLCAELFRRKMIDAVVHVAPRSPTSESPALFEMAISRSESEILSRSKSRYYPIEMSLVLREMQNTPGRYLVVGLPCFIKALRLLARQDSRIHERLAFCIGLVCGHLKSAAFADMLAWQMGIEPGELKAIDFRHKIAGQPASSYGILAMGRRDLEKAESISCINDLYGYNWGYGFFKYNACDYCDDVVGETADVSIGDAWLPEYTSDSNGTNVVIVRKSSIDAILSEAQSAGRIRLKRIDAEEVIQSQDAGLRHRREGLAYRLFLKDREGQWRPPKRVDASNSSLNSRQKRIQQLRIELATRSRLAFREAVASGDFDIFRKRMAPYVQSYNACYRPSLWRRIGSRILRTFIRRK